MTVNLAAAVVRCGALLLIFSLVATAQAADEVLMLTCQGTTRSNLDDAALKCKSTQRAF